ncbi:uncharacterized protein TrAtP1_011839 [Trichoderma atroviride]|uniref:uncharacterized protein n=1 Tax=Hypocrea atroviridis TaxID=63577 RepID=UPI00331963BB|nr:hypothetical protein TrAtP1_011839 [Trichoderma atroviride]
MRGGSDAAERTYELNSMLHLAVPPVARSLASAPEVGPNVQALVAPANKIQHFTSAPFFYERLQFHVHNILMPISTDAQ